MRAKLRAAFVVITSLVILNWLAAAPARAVTVVCRQTSPQSAYAARRLGNALSEWGLAGDDYQIILGVDPGRLQAEEFAIEPRGKLQAAIVHLQRALQYWDTVIEITRPIYRDMPLTHYNRNSRDANADNLFHWARIREEVARDVDIAHGALLRTR